MSVPDISSLFAACYSLPGSDREWMLGLVELLRPMMDCGFGLASWAFRVGDWSSERAVGIDTEIADLMTRVGSQAPSSIAAQFFLGARARPARERIGWRPGLDMHPEFGEFKKPGIRDFNALTLVDASGVGVALTAPSPQVLKSTRQSRARLERVGAHVLAGFRLRRALTQIDAVLGPDGRVLHAEHEARAPEHREALREAVKTLDRARSRERRIDPDTALEAFRSLISGRWSLVERFESDGRRYLVARRNPPGTMADVALTALEAQALVMRSQGASYKLVAYELDVSLASAHRMVQAGMRKLGVSHESELPLLIHLCASKLPNSFTESLGDG